MGGKESDELVLADLAAYIQELRDDEDDCSWIMGSGSTIDFMMDEWGIENTLLGVDVITASGEVLADITASELLEHVQTYRAKLVITLIGGQGHILGRGNQQLSPEVIRTIGRENILIVATKTKLQHLEGRPLICDTSDPELDTQLHGYMEVITGYNDKVLYPVGVEYRSKG
jgi:predicted polyphosphate/ATP-dependent NAD kinase